MTFEEIYQIVEESSHETAFNRGECEALYELCQQLPKKAEVLEIGVQFGRSITVLGLVGKEKGYHVRGVDNWEEDESPKAHAHIQEQIKKYDMPITLLSMSSREAAGLLDFQKFDLIHIDGDHTYEGVKTDIELWSSRVKTGGYFVFDDYEQKGLPDVRWAVNTFVSEHDFRFIGIYGGKLGVFKKL
jgi:predicted O-methyltransferase YrrM